MSTNQSLPTDPIKHNAAIRSTRSDNVENFRENPELKNSMLYWLPPLEKAVHNIDNVKIPDTLFVDVTTINAYKFASESDEDISDAEMESIMQCPAEWDSQQIKRAVDNIGYPAFIRTDTDSDKHNIENAGFITSDTIEHVDNTVDALIRGVAGNGGMMGAPRFNFLAVRQFIDIDDSFTAFNGTPIGPEVRLFARDGNVECHHFYWPFTEERVTESVDGDYDSEKETAIEEMKLIIDHAMDELLREAAAEISTHFEGYWSIDFAYTTNGDWYVIDMARGDDSWHPDQCEHVETEPQEEESLFDDIEALEEEI